MSNFDVVEEVKSWGWKARYQEGTDNRVMVFKAPYWNFYYTATICYDMDDQDTIEVGPNPHSKFVNSIETHRIWHVCPETKRMFWYSPDSMRTFLEQRGLLRDGMTRFNVRTLQPEHTGSNFIPAHTEKLRQHLEKKKSRRRRSF